MRMLTSLGFPSLCASLFPLSQEALFELVDIGVAEHSFRGFWETSEFSCEAL